MQSVKSKHGKVSLSSMLVLHTHSDPYLTFFYVIAHATMVSKNVDTRNMYVLVALTHVKIEIHLLAFGINPYT